MKPMYLFVCCAMLCAGVRANAEHTVLAAGNGKLVEVAPNGSIDWEMPWPGGLHDLHVLENGNILTVRNAKEVVEIEKASKSVVWSYNAAESNGNSGKAMEIHAIQPLPGGQIMIAESGPGRIIEIDREGTLLKNTALKVSKPDAHRDTRLARKLANGNYLVCHEGDGIVREYSGDDDSVVWEFPVPLFGKEPKPGHGPEAFGNQVFSALRLNNGNTLIGTGNGHSILEVAEDKTIVWELHQNDLPGITFAWITTLEVLPNGHIVIGNCHAGPGQPQIVEIEPKTQKVMWTFDLFELLGNDLTNSTLLDYARKSIR
ncbi:MAG: hypothetical protein AMXMBFR84_41930 [Candidatus Hydrogenedentota bacterium]